MVIHHLAKLGGHRGFGSGDMMFFVDEGQDFTYFRLIPRYLLSSKHIAWYARIHTILQ